MKEIMFYTRTQCPLCLKAKEALLIVQRDMQVSIKEIDIHSSDQLVERFGLMIPVVEYEGKVLQYGQIDPLKLQNQLK
ncbi:glutaredoxin [Peribacillus deserti]|uniref:Glutaredoxin n=1 Tax=Peribacillus deserti TaxID=673318 RepID=A0ABS2QEM5_9BACI|nr:glutaredoxin family protein [Peribacillus deserti]MBM7690983.1 glutaredoxin [Peribacillus deserti]